MVSCNCRLSTTRSVTTTTEWNTRSSSASCSEYNRWAVQAIDNDLPDPVECMIR